MDVVVALVGLALVVIVAAYVAQPLVVKARAGASAAEEAPLDKLLSERDALYAAIRDLDLDFQTGKLLEVDYRTVRETYTARGVEILKQLDAVSVPDRRPPADDQSRPSAVTDDIEAAVQARRKGRAQAVQAKVSDDEIEAAVRARRLAASQNPKSEIRNQKSEFGERKSKVGNQSCPSCGHPFDSTDRFCAKCGAALTLEATR
jgi:hypothetical protein